MCQANQRGLLVVELGYRPFTLSKSFFIGSQSYSASVFDLHDGEFQDISQSLLTVLGMNVAGNSFVGVDLPGTQPNAQFAPSDDLWVMYYQLGLFMPLFRIRGNPNHSAAPWD